MKINYKILSAILMCTFVFATFSGSAHAQAAAIECAYPNKAVTLYGLRICPDKFNADDDFSQWLEMSEKLPTLMPGAYGEGVMTAPKFCEHVRELQGLYASKAEQLMGFAGASLELKAEQSEEAKAYLKTFSENQVQPENLSDTAVINTMLWGDAAMLNKLLSFYDEQTKIKILIVKDMVDKARYLTLLHDSALDTCAGYAKEKAYYKIINYNGPDADYDPSKDEGWDALRKKWDAERAAQGRPPLSSISNDEQDN